MASTPQLNAETSWTEGSKRSERRPSVTCHTAQAISGRCEGSVRLCGSLECRKELVEEVSGYTSGRFILAKNLVGPLLGSMSRERGWRLTRELSCMLDPCPVGRADPELQTSRCAHTALLTSCTDKCTAHSWDVQRRCTIPAARRMAPPHATGRP